MGHAALYLSYGMIDSTGKKNKGDLFSKGGFGPLAWT